MIDNIDVLIMIPTMMMILITITGIINALQYYENILRNDYRTETPPYIGYVGIETAVVGLNQAQACEAAVKSWDVSL